MISADLRRFSAAVCVLSFFVFSAVACSTIVVGRSASATGRVLVGHNEDDDGDLSLRHGLVPARTHAAGTVLPAEPGCAAIPQVSRTCGFYWSEVKAPEGGLPNADVFLNRNGVFIVSNNGMCVPPEDAASTLTDGGLKYNLRRAVAERATSARQAVDVITNLVSTWGYAMPGRMYTVADRDEAWTVEIVRGRRFVARRCPDDQVVVIPNCYTIHAVEKGDVVSPDIADKVRADAAFDFAWAYQGGAACWKRPNDVYRFKHMYRLAAGRDFDKDDCPFSAKPSRLVRPEDVQAALSTHYEGSADEVKPKHGVGKTAGLPVCRESTVESTICVFGAATDDAELRVSLGPPCEKGYVSFKPFGEGLPVVLDRSPDAVRRLETHVKPELELHGRAVDVMTRVVGVNACGPENRTLELRAWRGERTHAQAVVWCEAPCGKVRLSWSKLSAAGGAEIGVGEVKARPVFAVAGVPDRLGDADEAEIGLSCYLPVWVTVDVPRTAKPDEYRGVFSVTASDGRTVAFPVVLTVLDRTLPERNDFFLDVWQNACAVARYHHVRPYSKEHYAVLAPLLKELAAAGQKAVTVPVCLHPWGPLIHDDFVSTVRDVRYSDGRCEFDFTVFDDFVAFARSCGIGPQIHCYTILKIARQTEYSYFDGATGEERKVRLEPGSAEWRKFLTPFLQALERHVEEKGWLADTYVAIDEAPAADQLMARAFLKEVSPRLKYACAVNRDGREFRDLDANVYSQILMEDYCSREFLDWMTARKAKGQIATFYVCTEPPHPNTWFKSPLVETSWLGLFAAKERFDGILRWAAFHWPDDPLTEASSRRVFPAGEEFLLYPNGQASVRWELFRDSIENCRKIAVLRQTGGVTSALERALSAIDFDAAKTDDEAAYREKVGAVLAELDGVR